MSPGLDERPTAGARGAPHVRWPAEAFYWVELDAAPLGPRPTRRQLGFLLEPSIPLPLERVHAIFVRVEGRRFVGCAVERERLERELPEGAVTLRPKAVPAFIAGGVDCERLNLLTGAFEPAAVRSLRRRWTITAAALVAVCAALVSMGLHRRADALSETASRIESLRRDLLRAAIGPAALRPDADLRLASELSRLRATRQAPTGAPGVDGHPHGDAASVLQELLRLWPRDVNLLAETVSVDPSAVTIVGAVPTSGDAQRAADAIGRIAGGRSDDGTPAPGWRLDQPQFESRRDGVNVTLRLRREDGE